MTSSVHPAGQRATLLGDGLGYVALSVEQVGERAEHLGAHGGIVLEKLEAIFQLRPGLAEPAQPPQHVGPVEPRGPDVLRRPLQRTSDFKLGIEPA
jgi:hypothetical protein